MSPHHLPIKPVDGAASRGRGCGAVKEQAIFGGEWEAVSLGEVAEIKSGSTPSTTVPAYWEGDIPWCTPTDITGTRGKYLDVTARCITPSGLDGCGACLLPPGALLLCSRATIGELKIAAMPVATNQGFKSLVCGESVSHEYLYYRLLLLKEPMAALATGSTFLEISKRDVASLQVLLPPLAEQRAIAAALSDVDGLIASLEALITKKREIKRTAMQQLLTGRTRLPGFEGVWETRPMGELAEMASGGTPPTSIGAYFDGDIPWVSITDMTRCGKVITSTERTLSPLGLTNSAARLFPVGTVLYAMYASLGECSIAGTLLCTSQAILGIQPRQSLITDFLYYWLTWAKCRVKVLGQQGTQANLNKDMVQELNLPVPLPTEQRAIATALSDMDDEIAALERRLDKTRAIKKGMMQQLLTGAVRLPIPDDGTEGDADGA